MRRSRKWLSAASVVAPAALLLFFAFSSGGFFPGASALAALALLAALVLRLTLADHPLAGCSPALAVAVGSLALLAAWTLVSGAWSDAPARSVLEYARTLAYVLALGFFGTLVRTPERLAWMARALAAAAVVVCAVGLVTRLAPDVWRVEPSAATDRLSYPLTYWNALGVLGAIGMVLLVHLTTSVREAPVARVLAAAAMPVVAVAIYFTFSRGAIAAGLVGVAVYLVVGRPTAWLTGLAAGAGAAAVVLVVALGADTLASDAFASRAGIAEGHRLALVVALAALGAAALRAAALPLDRRLARRAGGRAGWSPRRIAAAWAGALALACVLLVAAGAPAFAERQYDRFVEGDTTPEADQRDRLLNPGNNGRLDHWAVALDRFAARPLRGDGAGTYEVAWNREREIRLDVIDAHSLYLEVLAELGAVGLLLLLLALATVLGGLLRLARGAGRGPPAALFAAGLLWAIHAGIDWDWEMPATGLWLFAVGGVALAAAPGAPRLRPPGRVARVALSVGCLVLALTPLQVARSQATLEDAARAFVDGDCEAAIDASLASLEALRGRPEPFQLLAFCDVRLGYDDLAVANAELAVQRDPRSWEAWYGLALVRGAVGRDPRPAARRALELNPLEPLARAAVEAFETGSRAAWERRARRLRLPLR